MFRFLTIRKELFVNQPLFADVQNPLNEFEAKKFTEHSYLEIVKNMGIMCKQLTQTLYYDASRLRRNIIYIVAGWLETPGPSSIMFAFKYFSCVCTVAKTPLRRI